MVKQNHLKEPEWFQRSTNGQASHDGTLFYVGSNHFLPALTSLSSKFGPW